MVLTAERPQINEKYLVLVLIAIDGIIIFMFNPFSKSYKSLSEYSDTWSIGQGVLDEKPIFIRYRDGMKPAIGHTGYPNQIGVAIPLVNPTTDGLPSQAEGDRLSKIEDTLDRSLQKNDEAVFVLSITTGSMRELVFYASQWKPEYYDAKVKEVGKAFPEHQLQFMMQQDKDWATFTKFVK